MTSRGVSSPTAKTPLVTVQNPVRCRRAEVDELQRWMPRLTRDLAPQAGSLTLRLVGDREIRRLNRTFRRRDVSTDVLSFPCGEQLDDGTHLGDIALSVPTARRQARIQGHSLGRELKVLALHGLLHCLGYDHVVDDGAMERTERRLRSRWIDDGE